MFLDEALYLLQVQVYKFYNLDHPRLLKKSIANIPE